MIRATQIQTARFLLTRSHLIGEKGHDLVAMVQALVAVPAETLATSDLSLRSRLLNMTSTDLNAALVQSRRLIRRPAIRHECHLIAAADYLMIQTATQRQRRQYFNTEFINWDIQADEVEQMGRVIMDNFDHAALTMTALIARLEPTLIKELTQTSRGGRLTTSSNVELALRWLEANGQLIRIPVADSSTWQIDDYVYIPLSVWLPDIDLSQLPTEADAQLDLTRRYLATYGPATEADISFWTGFSKSETARAVGALTRETMLVMVDGLPGAMLLLKAEVDTLSAIQSAGEPVITVLPADDPFVIAHRASRARLIADPRLQRQVFNNAGQAQPTILVDGKIVGVWSLAEEADQPRLNWQLITEVDTMLLPLIETNLAEFSQSFNPQPRVERKE